MKEEQTTKVEEIKEEKVLGKRTPLYKQRASGIKAKTGFVRRLVVEHPGRVEMFKEAGWRPVTEKDQDLRDSRVQNDKALGSNLRQVVNRKGNATASHGVWMEIEENFYKEDQAHKNKMNDARQAGWNPKNIQKNNPDMYYGSELTIK